jgi:chromosome partitioning protein
MPQIIALSHQKGGVGKSTLTFNLANEFKDHLKTIVVDLDPQGTISQLSGKVKEFEIISFKEDLKELKLLPCDVVLVDTPPYLSSHLAELFKLSDLIIVPTKVGIADVMAIRATIKIIEEVKKTNQALIVLNMVKSNTSLTEEIKNIVKEHSIELAKTQIIDRVSYVRSLLSKGVKSDKKAIEEMETLVEEIVKKLKNKTVNN